MNANQYDEAISYGKQYIEDVIKTDFFDHLDEYTPDVINMHNFIINMFEFSCLHSDITDDNLTTLLTSLRIPTN